MKNLNKTGLKDKTPSETVLTTLSKDNTEHNAVIGVRRKETEKIRLKIYKNTKTYDNILRSKEGTVNIFSDAKTLLEYGLSEFLNKNPSPLFLESEEINCPYLKDSLASIEFEVDESEKKIVNDKIGKSQLVKITGAVKKVHIKEDIEPQPLKRANLYLIEAAIVGTRIREAEKKGNTEIAEKYVEKLDSIKNKCERIGPESEELNLISEIREKSSSLTKEK